MTDLELRIHPRQHNSYFLDLRLASDEGQLEELSVITTIDMEHLKRTAHDTRAYGRALRDYVFADEEARRLLRRALDGWKRPVRIRLVIDSDSAGLHMLRWETMQALDFDMPLLNKQVYFSRFISNRSGVSVAKQPKTNLRALTVVASPTDLERWSLAPISTERMLTITRKGLRDLKQIELSGTAANLDAIMAELKKEVDILYIVAHGKILNDNEPHLWLANAENISMRVSATDLVRQIRDLGRPPQLVVLMLCESAGNGRGFPDPYEPPLVALGPRIAAAGVPAVVAVQGQISMETAETFLATFLTELNRDGVVDRALAAARSVVANRYDSWMPVLFQRFSDGKLWRDFIGSGPADFERWPSLCASIRQGACTPVLGPGLMESLVGTPHAIAQSWADRYQFPMALSAREDLPQVAQFVGTNQNWQYMRYELSRTIREELARRFLGGDARNMERPLDDLFRAAAEKHWAKDRLDPINVLASFNLPLFITTTPDNLLEIALRQAGKSPTYAIFPWNDEFAAPPPIESDPTPKNPLIYHLFGRLPELNSLVLAEDDYFKYLLAVNEEKRRVPEFVRYRLTNTALLFLGFRLDDWGFRVMFHSFIRSNGQMLRGRFTHVAVQIDPRDTPLDPLRAREYLEKYFAGAEITIYWGSTQKFITELIQHMGGSIGMTRAFGT